AGYLGFTRRSRAVPRLRLLHGEPLVLLELLANALLLEPRQMIDEDLAVEVVDLMLDAGREQTGRLELERAAVAVERAHAHAPRAHDRLEDARHRQASFLHDLLAVGLDDLGIHEHLELIALLRQVDHDHTLEHA